MREKITLYLNLDADDFRELGQIGLHLLKTQPIYLVPNGKQKKGQIKKSAFSKSALVRRSIKEFIERNKQNGYS